jgi:transcriptional regulator with XRE-family HTH domain
MAAVRLRELGEQIKRARKEYSLTERGLAERLVPPLSEKAIRDLEGGTRNPGEHELRQICEYLKIPESSWRSFVSTISTFRANFESHLTELTGRAMGVGGLNSTDISALELLLSELFGKKLSPAETFDRFNRVLVFYGVQHVSDAFYAKYLTVEAFTSPQAFLEAVRGFQIDAVRLFNSISRAFATLASAADIRAELRSLAPNDVERFTNRSDWDAIAPISEDRLSDLGYISVARIKKEREERTALAAFLQELADKIATGDASTALASYREAKLRRMDSLLRNFKSTIPHGFLSPLFAPDSDALRREAETVAPKNEADLARMAETQRTAMQNLANYLSADYMDIYVATSMRTPADFVSVSRFVSGLFAMPKVSALRLRYFNPVMDRRPGCQGSCRGTYVTSRSGYNLHGSEG